MSEKVREAERKPTYLSVRLSAFEAFGSASGEGGEDSFSELHDITDDDERLNEVGRVSFERERDVRAIRTSEGSLSKRRASASVSLRSHEHQNNYLIFSCTPSINVHRS